MDDRAVVGRGGVGVEVMVTVAAAEGATAAACNGVAGDRAAVMAAACARIRGRRRVVAWQ